MPDSYTNLLYHIVFSTKDRRPLITPEHEARLYDYIGGTIRSLGGHQRVEQISCDFSYFVDGVIERCFIRL